MVTAYLVLLAAVAVERVVELRISRRNAAWAFAHGGVEVGQRHFRVMSVLHTLFLISCALEAFALRRPFIIELALPMFGLVIAAQALRYWAIGSLGRHWNVRVIVVPDTNVVTSGPYRYLRHPNYLAVILEGIALPLLHTCWLTALWFSIANIVLLWVRIRCEEVALTIHCDYGSSLAHRRRFVPGGV